MGTLQQGKALGHGIHIEGDRDVPAKPPPEQVGLGLVQDSIFICLSLDMVPGVKVQGDILDIFDQDIIPQEGIEPFFKGPRRDPGSGHKVTDLAQGMHARIGSAGGNEGHRMPQHDRQPILYGLLKGYGIFLSLPSMVVGSVIGQDKLDVPLVHCTKKGNPQGPPFIHLI